MDAKMLGKLLKEARLKKKMTQNEVVGNFITRNMLSQIESGAALPSVKTLEYLCTVLEIPANTLMTDSAEPNSNADDYIIIRKAFIKNDFETVINSAVPKGFEDEFTALKAKSYLCLADNFSKSDSISDNQKSVEYAKKAESIALNGIFNNENIVEKAQQIIKVCAQKLSEYYSNLL